MSTARDHGGGLDAAIARYGGARCDWVDLSTGINPVPYPVGELGADVWTALPDRGAYDNLTKAARTFWNVPEAAMVVPAPGASALIARLPLLAPRRPVQIPGPTYNEHAAAFRLHGFDVSGSADAPVQVFVHPNNPDGRVWSADEMGGTFRVIDESFCDVMPEASHVAQTALPGTVVLKSFGKFWGLAGARLGLAIGHRDTLGELAEHLGPWPVAGPTLEIAGRALQDEEWAAQTRARLAQDAARLDAMAEAAGAEVVGGTALFRLYQVADAEAWQHELSEHHVLTRVFPYNPRWIRFGLPHPDRWAQVARALGQ